MNITKAEVPIVIIDPPRGIRAKAWTVAYAPLGSPCRVEDTPTKAEALTRAREIYNQPPIQTGTGLLVPWDVTVNWKS